MSRYQKKKERLERQMRDAPSSVHLDKSTSNLFRIRTNAGQCLDVHDFNEVISIDPNKKWVEVEGMTTYEKLVDATLPYGLMPSVVPELKSITVGGAVSGTGLESSSFRFGFVHETVLEMDILLPKGNVITCTPENEYRDLFFGIPNSYGTLGYILRLKIKTTPIKPYVHLVHRRFSTTSVYFEAMKKESEKKAVDFIEGIVFSPDTNVLTLSTFCDEVPYTSDYTYMNIYYRSVLARNEDYLTVRDYIWRFDTDWFWRSDLFYAQNPLVRLLLGRKRLNSVFFTKIFRWNSRLKITERINQFFGVHKEQIVQDVEVPIQHAPAFLTFLHGEINILPIMIGPVIGSPVGIARFPLFPLDPKTLYINIGFYGIRRTDYPEWHLNKLVEKKVLELHGVKMLYSNSFYDQETFWRLYGEDTYKILKQKYDPTGKLVDLYAKCVKRL
ncbi:FAD-binding oxidoreductase [Candidatus Kaiserbacteria bacterium]|nr:FAD-binding oxidoreductase [Candidatus Kaiserbacteria bacterium]